MQKIKFLQSRFGIKIPTIENIKKGWNQFSKDYKNMVEKDVGKQTYNIMDRLGVFESKYKIALDIGCGSAELTKNIINNNIEQFEKIYCTDLSEQMIELAKQNVQNNKIEFKCTPVEKLINEFNPNTFDLIYSNLVLHLVPDYRIGLENICQLGKVNSKVFISVLGNKQNCNYFRLFSEIIQQYCIDYEEMRSIYHINDNLQDFQQDLKNSSLEIQNQGRQIVQIKLQDDFVERTMSFPSNQALLKNLSKQQINDIQRKFSQKVQQLDKPYLDLEILYFWCSINKILHKIAVFHSILKGLNLRTISCFLELFFKLYQQTGIFCFNKLRKLLEITLEIHHFCLYQIISISYRFSDYFFLRRAQIQCQKVYVFVMQILHKFYFSSTIWIQLHISKMLAITMLQIIQKFYKQSNEAFKLQCQFLLSFQVFKRFN